jgi:predicted GNAT family N-acyltransferase
MSLREPNAFTVTEVAFATAEAEIRAIRHEVFIVEQAVPEPEEWDGLDPHCAHALARLADGTAVGTARLAPGGKIGRMAVRGPFREKGVGSALLRVLMARARTQGERRCSLAAQLQAIPFYERHGFCAHGPVFLDANIEHREMTAELAFGTAADRAPLHASGPVARSEKE